MISGSTKINETAMNFTLLLSFDKNISPPDIKNISERIKENSKPVVFVNGRNCRNIEIINGRNNAINSWIFILSDNLY